MVKILDIFDSCFPPFQKLVEVANDKEPKLFGDSIVEFPLSNRNRYKIAILGRGIQQIGPQRVSKAY